MGSLPLSSPQGKPPKLLDQLAAKARMLHYSRRTESAYVDWNRRFILFHNKRHPREMGAAEIEAFLTHLAVDGQVAASTQNQAFSAILFLYQKVLEIKLPSLHALRAKRPTRLPVVLSVDEVRAVLAEIDGILVCYHPRLHAATRRPTRRKNQGAKVADSRMRTAGRRFERLR